MSAKTPGALGRVEHERPLRDRLRFAWKTFSLYRIVRIVSLSIHFFLQIYWFTRRHAQPFSERERSDWEALLAQQAARYRRTALSLEGLMIKLGQFLSTRADIMPKAFLVELEHLVDQVAPVPWGHVQSILHAEWQVDHREILREISREPVASASIGVVYRATLKSGEQVAIKVRRPGVDRIIRADFRALRIVMWMARHFTSLGERADLPALWREMVDVISDELNFVKEQQNGDYFRERYEAFAGVQVPRYIPEWCTRQVLVMEWMEGARVSDLDYLIAHGIDRTALAARLFSCFAEQLFAEGRFHADPHPGNLLVQPDGTIVIIDFGMIGTIRAQDVEQIRSLVEGIVFEDAPKIIASLEKLRFLLPNADRHALEQAILALISLYRRQGLRKFDAQTLEAILGDIQSTISQQPIQLPSEFAFLGRAMSVFVGVLHMLDPDVDIAALGKPIIRAWLDRQASTERARAASDEAAAGFKSEPKDQERGAWGSRWDHALLLRLAREYGSPVLRYPRLLEQALEEPVLRLEHDRREARAARWQRYHQTQKAYAFAAVVIGGAISLAGAWRGVAVLAWCGSVAFVAGVAWFAATVRAHARWLQQQDRQN
ncbi:MAG: AarF/UbiB family protein [Firmicutes bacterium]|nr:AarF/UbiB family protein [Bacillota bacterium]